MRIVGDYAIVRTYANKVGNRESLFGGLGEYAPIFLTMR